MTTPSHAERLQAILNELGMAQDPEMTETGERFIGWIEEWLVTTGPPSPTPLPTRSTSTVALTEIPFHSLCAHHLLPFFGEVEILYSPSQQIVGLGWFTKLVTHFARRPQLQERMADAIADTIVAAIQPRAVTVRIVARHLCMEMRGTDGHPKVEVVAKRGEAVIR